MKCWAPRDGKRVGSDLLRSIQGPGHSVGVARGEATDGDEMRALSLDSLRHVAPVEALRLAVEDGDLVLGPFHLQVRGELQSCRWGR